SDSGAQPVRPSVESLLDAERAAGIRTADFYRGFQAQANRIKRELLKFLIGCAEAGQTVVGYGAAAKGNTLLNFAGVRSDLLPFVVDKNPAKQGKYLPGSRIPICPPEAMLALRPDYVLILPWNIRAEIRAEYAGLEQQGSRFVVAVPQWSVL
ncbi:methyltransferase C-terminal domain-containing protein, partial [uncultured Thermosynechococcus sp.]|uniref:methyltransferase C-terminal domain-containing protein n=1 Tax=uncultured Thermosynechococcus sp. TaxID=436945 RepID=UPI00341F83ED